MHTEIFSIEKEATYSTEWALNLLTLEIENKFGALVKLWQRSVLENGEHRTLFFMEHNKDIDEKIKSEIIDLVYERMTRKDGCN